MTRGATWSLLLLLLGGCETTVHVRLSAGDDMLMAQECALAVHRMGSFYLELIREGEGQELIFKKCIDLSGHPASLGQLETDLVGRIAFEDVPPGGQWTIWVEGFSATECRKAGAPLLCGLESGLGMPPSDDQIIVNVSCVADKYFTWTSESLDSCRVK